tara:strand:+ start:8852 stop:10216 length:1365 start_codon:yes stop_codon:yes gene_type:complete
MENKRNYIEEIIAENANNELEALAVRQEIGVPIPQADLPNLKKDRIDFELINRTNEDQTIDLFSLPTGINPPQNLNYGDLFTTKYSTVTIPTTELVPASPQVYDVDWIDEGGTPQTANTASLGDIATLITQLIIITGDNFDYELVGANYIIYKIPINTWVYWNPPPATVPVTVPAGALAASFYTQNEFTTITGLTSTNAYSFTTYNVHEGTGISVLELSGNLTYVELSQELRSNITPYIFNDITVYANDINQANVPITKIFRGQAGNTMKLINNPSVFNQNKFVVSEEISLPTNTLNCLNYKVLANETVRIIITYSKGNLNAIAEIINEYIIDGIPFNVAINQLSEKVSEKEKEYLETTLRKVWERKKAELKIEGVEIEVENIFESQEVIDAKKQQALGDKMKLVKKHLEDKKIKINRLGGVSEKNIKRLVSNYVAKGDADEIHDPYSYMNDMD